MGKKSIKPLRLMNALAVAFSALLFTIGCDTNKPLVQYNNIEVETGLGTLVHTGINLVAPLPSQPIEMKWLSNITSGSIQPYGSQTNFSGVTTSLGGTTVPFIPYSFDQGNWPTSYSVTTI